MNIISTNTFSDHDKNDGRDRFDFLQNFGVAIFQKDESQ